MVATTAAVAAAAALNMKLLIDTKAQRVLFAEASKEVIDFLFSLLALPVGTAVKLLGEESMVGCVGNLYASVGMLDDAYVLSGAARDSLLRPTVPSPAASTGCSLFGLLARPAPPPPRPNKFFRCGGIDEEDDYYDSGYGYSRSCRNYMTDASDTACPSCGHRMVQEVQFLPSAGLRQPVEQEAAPGGGGDGFVQAVVTYTVMDDLAVKPMSAVSSITLLNTFAVTDLAALQERTVQIGHDKALGSSRPRCSPGLSSPMFTLARRLLPAMLEAD
ncbi:hypothetical protein C2845_PM07G01300 [Panicum miliaceum]|uniref:DUF674 domain-containing protein n=1 Tax=Panicum miliaceum TaxID=4540 RepID=A0A3L6SK70_PANMI|nr:hypothetical protein C2845_PM07G01300 [Panicum miliaceum]